MKITAHPDLITLIPFFRIGIITSTVKCETSSDKYIGIIKKTVEKVKIKFNLEEIKNQEVISETRKAYRKIGNDPNRYRPSADALIRRIIKGYDIYRINNVVDTLNLISLQSGYSIGGYDAEKIVGDIELGIGKTDEPYKGIGRGNINITKLIVLRDNLGAFGCPTSDSERTMITSSTNRIRFIFFDFGIHESLDSTLTQCSMLLEEYCYAEDIAIKYLDFRS